MCYELFSKNKFTIKQIAQIVGLSMSQVTVYKREYANLNTSKSDKNEQPE